MPTQIPITDFSRSLLDWFNQHGRHDLPWQQNVTPYRVWVSEIMLQQTQVKTVIPYFNRFTGRFPEITSLANAELDEILHLWTGLGYYARARNMYSTAKLVCEQHGGKFPENIDDLMALPGIGRSTAGAILSIAFGKSHPILDGNVKRVLTRYYAIDTWPGLPETEKQLWQLAEKHTPETQVAHYTQGIMDLGATVCLRRNPLCGECPVNPDCIAYQQSTQHLYPYRKPAKKLPVRKTVFTILENHRGEILLEHRSPAGIWGGLWSFPECAPENNPELWIERELGYPVNSLEYQAEIRHTFSHFHLDIMPVYARVAVNNLDKINDADHYCWYQPELGKPLGMATPVKKLLNKIILKSKGQSDV